MLEKLSIGNDDLQHFWGISFYKIWQIRHGHFNLRNIYIMNYVHQIYL